jgi:hypothetical protein
VSHIWLTVPDCLTTYRWKICYENNKKTLSPVEQSSQATWSSRTEVNKSDAFVILKTQVKHKYWDLDIKSPIRNTTSATERIVGVRELINFLYTINLNTSRYKVAAYRIPLTSFSFTSTFNTHELTGLKCCCYKRNMECSGEMVVARLHGVH